MAYNLNTYFAAMPWSVDLRTAYMASGRKAIDHAKQVASDHSGMFSTFPGGTARDAADSAMSDLESLGTADADDSDVKRIVTACLIESNAADEGSGVIEHAKEQIVPDIVQNAKDLPGDVVDKLPSASTIGMGLGLVLVVGVLLFLLVAKYEVK